MRMLTFIALTMIGAILLTVWKWIPETYQLLWVGCGSIILGICVLFLNVKAAGAQFVTFRKPTVRDFLGLISLPIVLLLVLMSGAVYGPQEVAIPGLNMRAHGSQSYQRDMPDKEAETVIDESREFRGGTSEKAEIDVPSRGIADSPKLAELWIEPLDKATAEAMSSQRIYVYQKSGSYFDGVAAWSNGADEQGEIINSVDGWTLIEPPRQGSPELHYKVHQKADFRNVYGLTGLKKVRLPWVVRLGSTYQFEASEEADLESYAAVSQPVNFLDLLEEELTIGQTAPHYSENPFNNALRGWARAMAAVVKLQDAPDLAQQLLLVKQVIQEQFSYSLQIENPDNLPAMENFLLHENRGYCVHFATATALLLRELGVPCRVSSGYLGGTHFPQDNTWVFYNHSAHAWVEVLTEERGWVVVDTTPQDQLLGGDTINDQSADKIPSEEEKAAAYEKFRQDQNAEEIWTDRVAPLSVFLVLALGLLSILLVLNARTKLKSNQQDQQESMEDERSSYKEKPYIAAYRSACQEKSIPMLYSDTLMDHVSWLTAEGKKPDFADELVQYHYDTTYRLQKPDRATERALLKRIKAWK